MGDADGVDFVVDVEAFDVFAVVFHDGVDKVVDGGIFVAHEDFAVEHFVVFEDVVDHFFVEVFWGGLKVDFHPTGFFGLEVDVAGMELVGRSLNQRDMCVSKLGVGDSRWFAVQSYADGFEFSF
jgi:hypothetical protein